MTPHTALTGLEWMHAATGRAPLSPHFHEEWVIAVPTSGVQRFDHRGSTHRCGPGMITVINAGDVHACHGGDGDWHYLSFHLNSSLLSALAADVGRPSSLAFSGSTLGDGVLAGQLLQLGRALTQSPDALTRESALVDTFGALIQRHMVPGAAPALADGRLARVRDRLASGDDVSLTELAIDAGMSRWQLSRAFAAQYGLAPVAWRRQYRVAQSRALLRQGEPAAQVASALGFADQAHFSRVFKSVMGMPPSHYQAASRGAPAAR
ncbi:helix-turn-helix domain-containing protein [Chitinibacteraceae bacterium HSL-7]